jgi:hypothetical protein
MKRGLLKTQAKPIFGRQTLGVATRRMTVWLLTA